MRSRAGQRQFLWDTVEQCADALPSGNFQDFKDKFNAGTSDNGNVAGFAAAGQQNFNRTYTYDTLNRIQTMSAPGDQCSGLSWTIDAWGNRRAQNNTGGSCFSPTASISVRNRLSGAPYQYDTAGDLTNDGFHTYTYYGEGRVTKVDNGATASYVYDALGARVEKTAGGSDSQYVYDQNGQMNTVFANGVFQRMYVYMKGQPLAEYFENTTYFVHTDHLGSTRLLTRLDQTVRESDDYYPYGELIPTTPGTGDINKFTGKEHDNETNLENFGARYDASFLGRFMTPDWAAKPVTVPYAVFGDPQSLNLYAYVTNHPLNAIDADGHGCGTGSGNALSHGGDGGGYSGGTTAACSAKEQTKALEVSWGTSVKTTETQDTRTTTYTQTTAKFSTAKGHEGEFLGATTQTVTTTTHLIGQDTTTTVSAPQAISYGRAVGIVGADALASGVAAALPSFATQFGRVTAQDAHAHPLKYVFAAGEVGLIFTPLPEASAVIEGMHEVKAAADAGVAAGDLTYELTSK